MKKQIMLTPNYHQIILYSMFMIIIIIIVNQKSFHTYGQHLDKFIGEQTIWEYLRDLCQQQQQENDSNTNIVFFVMENFHVFPQNFHNNHSNFNSSFASSMNDWRSSSSLISNFFDLHHCRYELFDNNHDTKTIMAEMKIRNKHSKYSNGLLLFNMVTLLDRLNRNSFETLLKSMEKISTNCINCFPLIGIFSQSIHIDLTTWFSQDLLNKLNRNFCCTLVSTSTNYGDIQRQQVIHLRPLLDGCRLYDGVYSPQTKLDFDRMKAPFHQCNLNKSLIKIAVNNVNTFE